jgi:hypothetical protein
MKIRVPYDLSPTKDEASGQNVQRVDLFRNKRRENEGAKGWWPNGGGRVSRRPAIKGRVNRR